MASDGVIFRDNVSINEKLHVVSDFDVNDTTTIDTSGNVVVGGTTNFQGNVSANGTHFLDVATGALSNISTVGCGAITSTGAVEGTSLTDGTISITAGDVTGAGSITATTLTDGTVSISAGDITGVGAFTAASVSDGTVSMAGDGTITGVSSINASGTLTGGTVTDGTFQ